MKKIVALFLALMMVLSVAALAETADVFTSASVANFYADYALTGDALMEAVNSQSGCYIVNTTNPDGSPNAGYFIFAIKKLNDKYYIQLGLAPKQSKTNLETNGEGLAVYAALPAADVLRVRCPLLLRSHPGSGGHGRAAEGCPSGCDVLRDRRSSAPGLIGHENEEGLFLKGNWPSFIVPLKREKNRHRTRRISS